MTTPEHDDLAAENACLRRQLRWLHTLTGYSSVSARREHDLRRDALLEELRGLHGRMRHAPFYAMSMDEWADSLQTIIDDHAAR